MAGAFLANNLLTADAVITADSEDAAYPVDNLYDKQAAKVFRAESQTALVVLIDFLAAIQADTIALINHNLSTGATLSLKAGAASPPAAVVATPTYRQYDLWKGFATVSARYWQLEITDMNTEDLEIGQLIIGRRTALPRGRRIAEGFKPARMRNVISAETYAGVFWNYYLFDRRQFNPSFRVGTAAELAVLSALDAAVHGNLYPFLYIPEQSNAECYYVRKDASFEPEEIGRVANSELVHDYHMNLIEESRGLKIQT